MTYPEKGASYKHEPKWIDRACRQEGGRTGDDDAGVSVKTTDESSAGGPWLGGQAPPISGIRGSATPPGVFVESPHTLQTGKMIVGKPTTPKSIWDQ